MTLEQRSFAVEMSKSLVFNSKVGVGRMWGFWIEIIALEQFHFLFCVNLMNLFCSNPQNFRKVCISYRLVL